MIRPAAATRLTMVVALLLCLGASDRAVPQPASSAQDAGKRRAEAPTDTRKSAPTPRPAPKAAPPAAQAAPQPLPVSIEQALYLIRSALLTLNDANRSGNYTVLRDLAAPRFQARNTAADLAIIFADLRRRNFDLFAVALAAPQLTAPPALDANGMLRLSGFFPTRPLQIKFDLLFENAGGQWRLFGIAVDTPQAPPPAQASGPPATAPKAASTKGVPAARAR